MVREHKIQIQNVTSVQYITIYIVLTTNVLPCLPLHEKKKKKRHQTLFYRVSCRTVITSSSLLGFKLL